MMDEDKLYNDLNNRIREVFDNYEDTTANKGWALLREKFPEKEKHRGLAWLWYAAAAVVLLGIGLWFIVKPNETQNLNLQAKHPKTIIQQHAPVNAAPAIDSLSHQTGSNATPYIAQGNTLKAPSAAVQPQLAVSTPHQAKTGIQTTTNNPVDKPAVSQNSTQGNPIAVITKHDSASVISKNTGIAAVGNSTDSVITNPAEKYAGTNPVQTPKSSPGITIEQMLNDKTAVKNSGNKTQNAAGKKTTMSVYAATYFNYAKGSDNNINVGAGFSSDFKLTKRLKLTAGVAIAQNTLKYSNSAIEGGDLNNAVSLAKTALNQVYASSAPVGSNIVTGSNTNGLRGFAIATFVSPALRDYNAKLIGLDIPINLKYQFNPQKTDAYISAGLSSGTFINETYTLNYTYAKTDQQAITHTSFSGFDVAKTLNVSFGVGYQLGKSNRLIFEPFLKYPLDGLGSQQIKFGAGGINLKLNFQTSKK
ncbi:hypothetical protein [Mucilaginibacter boryungensis]|uniref:Outer membrane protein with beta-barrel domain n=1 Tax=Mucilaginibacter boryungensis TaxID=768480 RepID=A0ABR9XJ64_9SPHI|nr:hypothetical protein [Mucilaginibacter boryungensis]MBE9667397.1 hypothetical protein [Mucilaginibacter boryungensis]